MNAVVGDITRYDQTDGRNVKAGCASGVGESEWHTEVLDAFLDYSRHLNGEDI
jgi:hypothetical protein